MLGSCTFPSITNILDYLTIHLWPVWFCAMFHQWCWGRLTNCLYLPKQFKKLTFVSSLKLDAWWLSLNKTCFAASEKIEGDSKWTKERSKQHTWALAFLQTQQEKHLQVSWSERQGSAFIFSCTLLPGRNNKFQFGELFTHDL